MKDAITGVFADFFCEYETPRQVLVRSKRVGVVCRLIQLGVLAYIIGWVFIYEKGYQIEDTAIGSVLTKMKGVGYTTEGEQKRLWDVADYVFPAQGDASFVVMTNYIITPRQKQDKCPELQDGKHRCSSDKDCEVGFRRTGSGHSVELKHGAACCFVEPLGSNLRHMTGKCVNDTRTCEVFAWCPVEDDRNIPDPALLLTAENYTLFIKNSVTFPQFDVVRSNLVEGVDNNYIKKCLYHPTDDPLCPIFRLGDIVKLSGFDFLHIARVGGAIGIRIEWVCNLDYNLKHCKPKYHFHGLYGSASEKDKARASVGYNFRHAKYYMEDKVEERTLMKVFGIRFNVIVRGLARKFDIIPTLTAIGSGVGIFGVATVVCDLVLLYVLPKRHFYHNLKFKSTVMEHEVNGSESSERTVPMADRDTKEPPPITVKE